MRTESSSIYRSFRTQCPICDALVDEPPDHCARCHQPFDGPTISDRIVCCLENLIPACILVFTILTLVCGVAALSAIGGVLVM